MKYLRTKTINLLIAALLTAGYLLTCPKITLGVVDMIPPAITVISPPQNSVIETARPWIEAQFGDSGAGINETTIFLALDQVNVTAQAVIEISGLKSQTAENRYRIRYQPKISLSPGEHEVYLSVRDQAENLAELRWRFEVASSEPVKIVFSGTNTLQWDETPLMKTNDILDLAAQTKVANTDVRLQLLSHCTDYPDATPIFQSDPYRFYLDKYFLSFKGQTSTLILGFGVTPIQSELFQSGMEVEGGIYTQKNDFSRGQLSWDVFSGETGGSYGINIDVNKIRGLTCGWESPSGWKLGTFYVQLGGGAGDDVMGLQGNTFSENGCLTRFEWSVKNSKSTGISENGLAFHLSQSFQAFEIGLDYNRLQPDQRPEEPSLSFSPEQGGVQQIGVRTVTKFNPQHSLGFNILWAENNLDRLDPDTTKQGNVLLDYTFIPDPGFNLDINYMEGFKSTEGASSNSSQKSDQTLSLMMKKQIQSGERESTLQTSLSLKNSQPSAPHSNGIDFGGAWTCPIGSAAPSEAAPSEAAPREAANLTPSLRLTQANKSDGSFSHTAEARLTLDFQSSPALPRNKVALIWNTDDEETPPLTSLGLESTLYLSLWPNSILSATCNLSHWLREDSGLSDGWDPKISLAWKINF